MRLVAGFVGVAIVHAAGAARAQGYVNDLSTSLTATSSSKSSTEWLKQRFAGSFANVSTYVGTGSFYTSGYRDPYVSNVLFLKPSFSLGTKYDLSLVGRAVLEVEYTKPDNPEARRVYPEDTWVSLVAKNLYTGPRSKIKIGGSTRLVLPTSYESWYSHLVTTWGVAVNASRPWQFGRPNAQGKRWNLVVAAGTGAYKAFQTSEIRGSHPGDTTGCRLQGPANAAGGPSGVGNDRCGGPLNTNYTIMSSGLVDLTRGPWNLSVSLVVINNFKYSVDPSTWPTMQQGTPLLPNTDYTIPAGRQDITWGMITLSRELTSHYSLSAGLASYQPAMTDDFKSLRFPFFDFLGTNAKNYTQFFLGVTGTL